MITVYFDGDQTLWDFQALMRRTLESTVHELRARREHAYGARNLSETANSNLKDHHGRFAKGSIKVLGKRKIALAQGILRGRREHPVDLQHAYRVVRALDGRD